MQRMREEKTIGDLYYLVATSAREKLLSCDDLLAFVRNLLTEVICLLSAAHARDTVY
jgi:hypothetical protein